MKKRKKMNQFPSRLLSANVKTQYFEKRRSEPSFGCVGFVCAFVRFFCTQSVMLHTYLVEPSSPLYVDLALVTWWPDVWWNDAESQSSHRSLTLVYTGTSIQTHIQPTDNIVIHMHIVNGIVKKRNCILCLSVRHLIASYCRSLMRLLNFHAEKNNMFDSDFSTHTHSAPWQYHISVWIMLIISGEFRQLTPHSASTFL